MELELKDGRNVKFEIQQATFGELLEMTERIDGESDMRAWLFDLLLKKASSSVKIKREDLGGLMPKRVVEIINWLMETYGKGFFVREEKKPQDKLKEKAREKGKLKEEEDDSDTPSSSLICFLLENTNETLSTLMGLTWEQIEYLMQGVIWNKNATTKEGRRANKRNLALKKMKRQWTDEQAIEMVRKMEEKINAGKVKFGNAQNIKK